MAGTVAGASKAAAKNLARDPLFYARIGAKGGRNSNTGGFNSEKVGTDGLTGFERAKVAGKIGGTRSRRRAKTTV